MKSSSTLWIEDKHSLSFTLLLSEASFCIFAVPLINIDKHPKAKEDGLALLKEILLRFKLTIVLSNVTNFTPDYKYDNDFSLDTLLKEFHLDEYISNPLSIFINGTAKIQKEASESNKVNDNECLQN